MSRDDLEKLTKEELVELVLKLQRPAKTSRTSSKPPSTDNKERRENSKPGGAKAGHKGHFRGLAEVADQTTDHRPDRCSGCGHVFEPDTAGDVIGEYDRGPDVNEPGIEAVTVLLYTYPADDSVR